MMVMEAKKRTIYLDRNLDTNLRVFAAKADKPVSTIIGEAIQMYLKAKKFEVS